MAPVINSVMMPVLLLSGILLPMTLGPTWLQSGQRLHADQARGGRRPRLLRRRPRVVHRALGLGLGGAAHGRAVWWGTTTFRKENA